MVLRLRRPQPGAWWITRAARHAVAWPLSHVRRALPISLLQHGALQCAECSGTFETGGGKDMRLAVIRASFLVCEAGCWQCVAVCVTLCCVPVDRAPHLQSALHGSNA